METKTKPMSTEELTEFVGRFPAVETKVASLEDILHGLDAKIDKMGQPAAKADDKAEVAESDDTAPLAEIGAIAKVTRIEVAGFPLGQVIIGGASAVFVTELVDGFMARMGQGKMVSGLVKGAVAVLVAGKQGKRVLGANGAMAAAILIGFDALRDLVPIDSWVQDLTSRISGVTASRGLAAESKYNILKEAEAVARGHYAGMGV